MWKVLSNPVEDKFVYQVYRIRDSRQPMHSGNIETTGVVYSSDADAQAEADRLNQEAE